MDDAKPVAVGPRRGSARLKSELLDVNYGTVLLKHTGPEIGAVESLKHTRSPERDPSAFPGSVTGKSVQPHFGT